MKNEDITKILNQGAGKSREGKQKNLLNSKEGKGKEQEDEEGIGHQFEEKSKRLEQDSFDFNERESSSEGRDDFSELSDSSEDFNRDPNSNVEF